MRLTLRAMLAYLNEILDPKDAEEIGKKIEQSETATNLMHRIRDVMRRLRLGAPSVTDRGGGLDPNTVAEYLDNTLPDARVPDFEKVCLESDVHLAEVASCHQVLALVLGEPAEVDPASRQQMYELPEVLASKTKPTPPKLPDRPATDGDHQEPVHAARSKPPVPEYLRETARKRRLWRIVMGGVVLATVVLAVLHATGQFRPGSQLERVAGLDEGRAPVALAPGQGSQPEVKPAVTEEPGNGEKNANGQKTSTPQKEADSSPLRQPTSIVEETKSPAPIAKTPASPPSTAVEKTAKSPEKPAGAGNPLRETATEPQSKVPPTTPAVGMPTAPAEGGAATVPVPPVEANPKKSPSAPPAPTAPAAPLPVEQVAKYISPTGMLLRFDADSAAWQRVSPNTLLNSQDKILSLPAYRPVLLLVGDVRMELVEGARVDLKPADGQGTPAIGIDFGRVILRSDAKETARIRVHIGERNGLLSFGDAESVVAIQAGRVRTPGVDPEVQPLPRVADLWVTTGKIVWQEADRAPVAVNGPVRLTLNDKPIEAIALQQLPTWIDPEAVVSLEQQASATVDRETQGRPIGLALRELADHRKREVRFLVMRCLGYLGDFQPVVSALNDVEKKLDWPEYSERLREAVVRSPDTAAAIRSTMQKQYGNDGVSMYELLWKYPDDRLSPEDTAQLIRYLDHDSLGVRVLAFWGNLKRVTGLGLFYRPEDSSAKRQPSIAKWRERTKSAPAAAGGESREKKDAVPALPVPRESSEDDKSS